MKEDVKVVRVPDMPPGSARVIQAKGKEVALYNVDGNFYATSNVCPHQGAPLGEGTLEGNQVICPWHAWVFKVTDGTSPVNPRLSIATFPVRVDGEDVIVSL